MFSIDIHKLANELLYQPEAPLIFNSGLFLFLFVFFLLVYIPLSKTHRPKLLFVTLFSLYFYYKSSGWYFLLLLSTVAIDYHLAAAIGRARQKSTRQILLALSIIANLGVLGYFKYTNLFIELISPLADVPYQPLDIFLPVGISFFTFQSMSYTIDVYRGHLRPVEHILDYAFFVSFFPQLVAGPIVRAADFLPQLKMPTMVTREMFGRGIFLITTGLFKKAIISNYISLNFVDRVFDAPSLYSGLENLMAVYGYALQIYCDFSGYSDMAIGLALILGFHFNLNFDSPYQSKNITEFWRRWHMSLSSWLRDYLYISLGGNRKGRARTYLNLFLTMVLGGLWHGAAWRFVLWGALHGSALAFHKLVAGRTASVSSPVPAMVSTLLTFHFVCFCWIFFRAADMQIAGDMLWQIAVQFRAELLPEFIAGYPWVVGLMTLGYVLHFVPARMERWAIRKTTDLPLAGQTALLTVVILWVIQTKSASIQPFIYFQF